MVGKAGGCVIFQGTPFEGDYARFHPALSFNDRYGGRWETLWTSQAFTDTLGWSWEQGEDQWVIDGKRSMSD